MAGGKYKVNAEKSRYSLANKRNATTSTRKSGVRNRQWQFSEGNTGRPVETPEEAARREAKEAKAAKNAAYLESLKMFEGMDVNDDEEGEGEQLVTVQLSVGSETGGVQAAGRGEGQHVTISIAGVPSRAEEEEEEDESMDPEEE